MERGREDANRIWWEGHERVVREVSDRDSQFNSPRPVPLRSGGHPGKESVEWRVVTPLSSYVTRVCVQHL